MIFCLVLALKRSFALVTLLEGSSITLSCTPNITEVVLKWTHNGEEVVQREDITFTPSILHHNLTIGNTMERDTGVYVCRAALEDMNIEQNITVNVVPGTV